MAMLTTRHGHACCGSAYYGSTYHGPTVKVLLGSCLFTVIVATLVLACVLAVQSILEAAAVPTFRLVGTGNRPDLALAKGHRWHLFLSQCA